MRESGFEVSAMLGVATASAQIEGGDRNNSWYDWAQLPGTIRDGSTPVRATDHWQRWREDTDLMASLGIQTYRMSLEWARIEPSIGQFDDAALQRYHDEIAYIRSKGIVPLVALHHFSNPSWFQAMGEWTNPRSVALFERYARVAVQALGEVVTDWVTINEPNVYATQGYLQCDAPPGTGSWIAIRRCLRNMAIAHCRTYRLIHDLVPGAQVGFAHHLRPFDPLNAANPAHRIMAKATDYLFQGAITDAMLGGRFPALLGKQPVDRGAYYDYLGINYYSRTAVDKLDDGTFPGTPVNDLEWEIYPEGLQRVIATLTEKYPGRVWITENGTCDNDETFRSKYIYDHLRLIADAALPVDRYYHWCFVDNWEWHEGEVPRFGLVALDYETQERTIKPSGEFYADIIRNHAVTEAAYEKYVAGQRYRIGTS